MKQDLKEHIGDIFNSLRISTSFEVYECSVDIMPDWSTAIRLTNEFIVCCEDVSVKRKLQAFTGKILFELDNCIYWFEGESINTTEGVENCTSIEKKEDNIEYLKTETRLPLFLDKFIFDNLKAEYAPNFKRFDYNLDLTNTEILKYLGTYFPRSYAESFCIFDNVFQNENYYKIVSSKEILNVLTVGSGSGGDLIGVLTNINKYCQKTSKINIWAIDGNLEALSVLQQIIESFRSETNKNINLTIITSVFDSISSIDTDQIADVKFDFILSFKLICEIIATGKGRLDDSYYDFMYKFLPMLSSSGLCLMLDVTTKPKHTTYNPILMNRQINRALRELKEYKTLLPLSCNLYGETCYSDCFCQKIFTVAHQKRAKDKSKVTYRIIANNDLVIKIGIIDYNERLLINNSTACPTSEEKSKTADAYLLKTK